MADPDSMPQGKTIYDASKRDILWRNFLAGFARGFGNFIFTIIIFFVITTLIAEFLMPVINPLFESMGATGAGIEQLEELLQNSGYVQNP